jgi:hypothetical protein
LPDSTTQHVDDAGKPKKDLTNWLTSVQATIKSLNAAVTGVSGLLTTALLKANNLSDLTNVGTARTNLSLGNVATLNVNVANGVPQFNGSGQYPAADGQLIANIGAGLFATPSVGTTIYAQVNVNVGSFVGCPLLTLGSGWVPTHSQLTALPGLGRMSPRTQREAPMGSQWLPFLKDTHDHHAYQPALHER